MATRTRTTTPFDALVRALRPRTPDVAVRKRTADLLYDADVGNRTLIGVLSGAEEAVYYSTRTRCVAAVPITDVGPNLGGARPLGQAVDDPTRAFEHVDQEWAWTNPELRERPLAH
ncbi:hypothetical protein [Halolamina sp. C58]|uniref:hypothetical protein n=1 Tax=Halolamina sp. C58 TaxID=3421640 RepID=UPI003EBF66BA